MLLIVYWHNNSDSYIYQMFILCQALFRVLLRLLTHSVLKTFGSRYYYCFYFMHKVTVRHGQIGN